MLRMSNKRIVVTGMGILSPNGLGKEAFWNSTRKGISGIKKLSLPELDRYPIKIGGQINDFFPENYMDRKKIKHTDRANHFAIAAAKLAIDDAKLDLSKENRNNIGVTIGSTIESIAFGEQQHEQYLKGKKASPFLATIVFGGSLSSQISIELQVFGPSLSISTGCPSAIDAISCGINLIKEGKINVLIGGGIEAPFSPLVVSSFAIIGALSKNTREPQKVSCPFDARRDGFVLSEGGAIFVIEELEHAKKRGAHIYGEIKGIGSTCDAYHITQPQPEGTQVIRAIEGALKDSHIAPEQIDYINAHGTSTPLNDKVETLIIKKVFGKRAYQIPISSTKSIVGHFMGAAGAIELAASLLIMENNFIHPTINYEIPDPECDLDYVPNVGRKQKINVMLSNSIGFGGKNSCIIITKI